MVARHPIPHRARRKSQHGAHPESRAPTQMDHNVADDGRGEGRTRANAGEDQAVGQAALGGGNPVGHPAVRTGVHDRFAHAQKEPHRPDDQECVRDAGGKAGRKGGEGCPPRGAQGQHAARSKSVNRPAAGDLKESIADKKGAEDLAELHVREVKILGDGMPGNGNIDAVNKTDRPHQKDPANQHPTNASWRERAHEKICDSFDRPCRRASQSPMIWPRRQQSLAGMRSNGQSRPPGVAALDR